MAVNLLAELFDGEGKKLNESFFSSLISVKNWAKENNATFIRLTDTIEKTETYYLKAGAQGRWTEAPKETFDFIVNRNKREGKTQN
jgi:hypothetical protein